ncbi:MAG: hypothetical protein N4A47_06790 [Clostridia bacterium]|jgi:uncharacterized FAD-dependent dehydrogenase|nr:hypothetical protein [Clostridia bacterium]
MLKISNLKVKVEEISKINKLIAKKLKIKEELITDLSVIRQSIDARDKSNIFYNCSVAIEIENEEKYLKTKDVSIYKKVNYSIPEKGNLEINKRPVVVGFGPSGMFAALILAEAGYKPIVIERGKRVDEREKDIIEFWKNGNLNEESNVQYGEGGAGTFSDGKLTTLTKDKSGRFAKVLNEFVLAGAPEDILYKAKPHIGTDYLKLVVKNIREKIINLGGEIVFSSKLTDIDITDGKISSIEINNDKKINTDVLMLCIGHSARDTFEMLYDKNINIEQKDFSVGVRIEHPQDLINESQYGDFADSLPAAEYKLVHHEEDRSAYTFCMCPGGKVVASASEENMVVTNGMSEYKRDSENANSALLVGVKKDDFASIHPLAGMYFQRELEKKAFELGGKNYNAPAQLVGDFLNDKASIRLGKVKPTYEPGIKLTNLSECLPDYVVETMRKALTNMGRKLKGFDMDDAIMTAVETRTSSPVRITRNEINQTNISGIYPVGEGAGYAGGIMSAAVDGMRMAESVIKLYLYKK